MYTRAMIRLGYPTQNLTIPASTNRTLRLASQDPAKQAGADAYTVESRDWHVLLAALEGREADVMGEAIG